MLILDSRHTPHTVTFHERRIVHDILLCEYAPPILRPWSFILLVILLQLYSEMRTTRAVAKEFCIEVEPKAQEALCSENAVPRKAGASRSRYCCYCREANMF